MVSEQEAERLQNRWKGWLAGAVSAGFALGWAEIGASLFDNVTSPVIAVGDLMVDAVPGALIRFTIGLFGASQKTVLVWGITLVLLLVGAILSGLAWRRWHSASTSALKLLIGTYGVVALIGGIAMSREPGASIVGSFAVIGAAAIIGAATNAGLLKLLAEVRTTPDDEFGPNLERRSFSRAIVAVGVGALGVGWFGRYLSQRKTVDSARQNAARLLVQSTPTAVPPAESAASTPAPTAEIPQTPSVAVGLESEIEGLTPLYVPNEDYYRIDTALRVPQVDPANWSLKITGMVDNEVSYSYEDLLQRATTEAAVTLSCVSNEVGGNLVGNALWRGVPLRDLLDEAGVHSDAEQIMGRSVDGWSGGFPLAHLDDPKIDALVAVAMNGEPLPVSHGFPARLVISGLYGYVSATKWLSEIELAPWEGVDGYWIPRGWSKTGPVKTQSRIDVPLRQDRGELPSGETAVAGIAWAPGRGIEKVEIQVDDGVWEEAELAPEGQIGEWRQWVFRWNAPAGEHRLRVRATDGSGETQTDEVRPPAPDGASGYHAIRVNVV